jgi:hypothetical protein
MNISIINHTGGHITDEELQQTIRAINRQIHEDFEPHWGMGATLRLEGRSAAKPETAQLSDMRGDAVIYLWNEADVDNALGYHFQNNSGVPFGFVFTEIAASIGESWSVTLSHEALELLADPETNLLVIGPHPTEDRDVFHWFEMCDAVQDESYEIDGVGLSNFLLPLYFTGTRETDELGARNDFLGRSHSGRTLTSFGINPGGYIGFFDPVLGESDTFSIKGDAKALKRLEAKAQAKEARRSVRYRQFAEREKLRKRAAAAAGGKRVQAAPKPAMASVREQLPVLALRDKGLEVLIERVGPGGKRGSGGAKRKSAKPGRK